MNCGHQWQWGASCPVGALATWPCVLLAGSPCSPGGSEGVPQQGALWLLPFPVGWHVCAQQRPGTRGARGGGGEVGWPPCSREEAALPAGRHGPVSGPRGGEEVRRGLHLPRGRLQSMIAEGKEGTCGWRHQQCSRRTKPPHRHPSGHGDSPWVSPGALPTGGVCATVPRPQSLRARGKPAC